MAAAAEGAAGGAPSPRRSTEKTKRAVGLEGAGENGDWDVFSLSLSLSPSLSFHSSASGASPSTQRIVSSLPTTGALAARAVARVKIWGS